MGLEKVISGGQTGVDRATLDAAIALNYPVGGWCPKGRRAEDGIIPCRYPLKETVSREYAERTRLNVRDSDGTLVLSNASSSKGTQLTIEVARRLKKPFLVDSLDDTRSVEKVQAWIQEHEIKVLNIAGPRESESPGIYARALPHIQTILKSLL